VRQYEAVIRVMGENGGFATLGHLYQYALRVRGVEWGTKTPFASIRRIVQERPEIFKIRPGLWALTEYRDRLPDGMVPERAGKKEVEKFGHTYYQGLLLEVGKLKNLGTYVPAQDKNRKFLGKCRLGEIATLSRIHPFGYDKLVSCARTIDVIWFNERNMPDSFFEVEHSTNIKNSLIKYVELQDFRARMFIVADDTRRSAFKRTIDMAAFRDVRRSVDFISYDDISRQHSEAYRVWLWGQADWPLLKEICG